MEKKEKIVFVVCVTLAGCALRRSQSPSEMGSSDAQVVSQNPPHPSQKMACGAGKLRCTLSKGSPCLVADLFQGSGVSDAIPLTQKHPMVIVRMSNLEPANRIQLEQGSAYCFNKDPLYLPARTALMGARNGFNASPFWPALKYEEKSCFVLTSRLNCDTNVPHCLDLMGNEIPCS